MLSMRDLIDIKKRCDTEFKNSNLTEEVKKEFSQYRREITHLLLCAMETKDGDRELTEYLDYYDENHNDNFVSQTNFYCDLAIKLCLLLKHGRLDYAVDDLIEIEKKVDPNYSCRPEGSDEDETMFNTTYEQLFKNAFYDALMVTHADKIWINEAGDAMIAYCPENEDETFRSPNTTNNRLQKEIRENPSQPIKK